MNQPALYVVATPIGNRSDMSPRAIEVLSGVDLIAAEDTRHSRHLCQYFNITTPMIAYHDHNEQQQTPILIEKLKSGLSVALVSDAGTPLLSDPGYRLVKAAHEAGITVSPIPGPSAAIAALSVSGLATDRFCFVGFPPAKTGARKAFYESLVRDTATLVFYESSHRIEASLLDMVEVFGPDRQALLAREISKAFETVRNARLTELADWVANDENQRKGEFVIVIQGDEPSNEEAMAVDLRRMLEILLEELPVKQASQLAAKISGMKKNQVYKLALELKDN